MVRELVIPVGSREYLYESLGDLAGRFVEAEEAELAVATVKFAVVPAGVTPGIGDWKAGEWFTDDAGEVWARALLGDVVTLAEGILDAWIQPTVGEEIPQRRFARLYVS